MSIKYIRIQQLATKPAHNGKPAFAGRLPVSQATIWRWVKLGTFPKPFRLGPGVTAWKIDDVEQWELLQESKKA